MVSVDCPGPGDAGKKDMRASALGARGSLGRASSSVAQSCYFLPLETGGALAGIMNQYLQRPCM